MNHKRQVMSLLLTLITIAGMVLPVAAQEGDLPVNCNGLSEADCAILIEASQAMQGQMLQSLEIPSVSFMLNLDAGADSITAHGVGAGRFVMSDAIVAMLSDLPVLAEGGGDRDAMLAFLEQIDADMLIRLLEGLGIEININKLALTAPGESMSLNADIIFKDMGLYMYTMAPNGADAWFGEQLEITDEMKQELDAELDTMIASLQDVEEEIIGPVEDINALLVPLTDLVTEHVSVSRGEDDELFGQTNYLFTSQFDLKGFLADPQLPAAIMTILQDPMLAELTGEELGMEINEAQIQFVLMTANLLLGESILSTTEYIGADDLLPHKVVFNMLIDLDLSLLGDPEITNVLIDSQLMMEMDGYNSTSMDDVTIPTDYYPMDMSGRFLAGGPDLIEAKLALGTTFSGSLSDSDTDDMYAIMLSAGQTVQLEVKSDGYPYVTIYGPDGFEITSFDLYFDEDTEITAETDGMYLIVIESYWEMDYDLTVRAK